MYLLRFFYSPVAVVFFSYHHLFVEEKNICQVKFSHILDFADCIATMVLCFCFLMFLYPLYLLKIENSANGLIIISSDFFWWGGAQIL